MKLKLVGQVVTPIESHMSMDGRTDGQMDEPCQTMIRDFRQAYENCGLYCVKMCLINAHFKLQSIT